jgi:hypothetical protein
MRSGTTTRSQSPNPPSEEQRLRQERRMQLAGERIASKPHKQFSAQVEEERRRIWNADPSTSWIEVGARTAQLDDSLAALCRCASWLRARPTSQSRPATAEGMAGCPGPFERFSCAIEPCIVFLSLRRIMWVRSEPVRHHLGTRLSRTQKEPLEHAIKFWGNLYGYNNIYQAK